MAIEVKTLASGRLKVQHDTAPLLGELVLYAAPHPSEPFQATSKKAALVTAMRFFSREAATINLSFVRYNAGRRIEERDRSFILPLNMRLNSGELKVDSTPLVLEEGDAILGHASIPNVVQYVVSGVEQEV